MNARLYYRNFVKYRRENLVTLAGLSLALMITILSVSYIIFEYSFDTFHSKADRIFTVYTRIKATGGDAISYAVESGLAEYSGDNIPEAGKSCIIKELRTEIGYNDAVYTGIDGYYTEPAMFSMFDFGLITGDPASLLDPGSVILTGRLSGRLTGTANCSGALVTINGRIHTVAGIVKDPPVNSNLEFDFLLPYSEAQGEAGSGSGSDKVNLFLLTNGKIGTDDLRKKLDGYFTSSGRDSERCEVVRLKDLHRYGTGKDKSILILAAVSFLVLFISMVNFTNSNSACIEARRKEIGLRKVSGATGPRVTWMLVTDSLRTVFIASVAGYILSAIALDYFQKLTSVTVRLWGPGLWKIQAVVILLVLLLGLVAGLITTAGISGARPAALIMGAAPIKRKMSASGILAGLQFAVSGGLLSMMIIIFHQLSMLKTADMGFDPDNRLLIRLSSVHSEKYETIRSELMNFNGVDDVTGRGSAFGNADMAMTVTWGDNPSENHLFVLGYNVKKNFFECYGIKIIEGQTFSDFSKSDPNRVIIDRYTADMLGMEHPAGNKIHGAGRSLEIIGLADNADFTSLSDKRLPRIYVQFYDDCAEMTVKYHDDIKPVLTEISTLLTQTDPSYQFDYISLRDAVTGLYDKETNLFSLIGICGLIAILLSVSGAYAMALYFEKNRIREYGIRKVYGASSGRITILSVSGIILPVVIGTLTTMPAVILISGSWLSHFSARVSIGLMPFLVALVSMASLALVTVYSVSRRAALRNPAEILRQI
jgi:putative ABC transport system permease protein